jgi:histidyl-tRNA synthetase
MAVTKPATLKGTRDLGPEMMMKRNFIFDTIKTVFKKFGYLQIETPSMEKLEVLTGKYGEEGDQLIFKVLNSGEKVKKADLEALKNEELTKFASSLSEKAMRYDLTVPFARFVAMNHMELAMPFKRFQIQPVWRADRPQKGRYQEFFQCDADVVGTESLLCEAEVILMISEVFEKLKLTDYTIKINNRKVLAGLSEAIQCGEKQGDLFVAIDKLDKLPVETVMQGLLDRAFNTSQVETVKQYVSSSSIKEISSLLSNSKEAQLGISEIEEVQEILNTYGYDAKHLEFDPKLARGLSYYTGCIFEVKINNVTMGSVSGGGRYNNLTEVFGLPNMPGIGFSFGVDRIFDVMEELELFPSFEAETTQVLITNFDEECFKKSLPIVKKLRDLNIKTELYPVSDKIKKQFNYANKKGISYVLVAGTEEFNSNQFALKNMQSGEQEILSIDKIIEKLS